MHFPLSRHTTSLLTGAPSTSALALAAILLAAFCISFPSVLFAQKDPKALEHSRAGYDYEQKKMFEEALYEYGEAIKLDSSYPYPWSRVAGMYQTLKNHRLAVQYYHRAIKIDSSFDAYNYYNLGTSLRVLQKPDSAAYAFTQFVKRMVPFTSFDTVQMREADFWIKFNLESQAERLKPPAGDAPINVPGLNSDYDDYGVSMTADGENMYFTSRRPSSNIRQYYDTRDFGDDLFMSTRDSIRNWRKPIALDPPLNQVDEDGSAFISADGLTMFTTLCRRPEGVGDCDIYISEATADGWTTPQNLGRVVNSPAWDGQPSMTADGSTMYFSSSRQGSLGSSEDIYVVYRGSGGSWTRPLNLGEVVNTRFNDRSPFISADGKTLYFSSNGHPGYGNHDIFMTRKLDDGTWSKPVNIGAPINSFGEDAYLSIPARGDTVYYSSQRDDAANDLDIYKSKLPTEFRPGPVTVIAGRVIDKVTSKPVAASINVTDLAGDELVAVYRANPVSGKFFITLGTGKHYGITATAPGYVFYSENYTVPDTIPYREIMHDLPLTPLGDLAANDPKNPPAKDPTKPPVKDPNKPPVKDPNKPPVKDPNKPPVKDPSKPPVKDPNKPPVKDPNKPPVKDPNKPPVKDPNKPPVKDPNKPPVKDPVTIDSPSTEQPRTIIALNNIFFDFNKATLRTESVTELNNLVKLMKDNPKLRIEIAGHTDSIGTADINNRLSQMRAEEVKQYLVDWGITSARLRAKGYGATRPVATNDTEEGRQQNRRTEFEILNLAPAKK